MKCYEDSYDDDDDDDDNNNNNNTTHLHLGLRLRMSGVLPPSFIWSRGVDRKHVYILQHKNSNSNKQNELLSSGPRHANVWGQRRYCSTYVLSSELDGAQ